MPLILEIDETKYFVDSNWPGWSACSRYLDPAESVSRS
jgi:hypothetical protein